MDPYEERLLGVFESCLPDGGGVGGLGETGLIKLCDLLHLSPSRRAPLLSSLTPPVAFHDFRDALLDVLQANRLPSPDREVSPKFVYGQKKYGRRSRPESLDHPDETCRDLTIEEVENDTFIMSSPVINGNSCSSPDILAEKLDQEDEDLNTNSITASFDKGNEGRAEIELRAAWERLGVGRDGYLDRNELAMVCSAVDMDTVADQVVAQVFSNLRTDEVGRISFEEFLQLFRSAIPTSPSISPEGYVKSSNNSDLWDSGGMNAARLLQEVQTTRSLLEAVTEERDKLRIDLAESNRRANALAQEVDEHNARVEKATRNTVKHLEQRHLDEMKELRRQSGLERDQLSAANQQIEARATAHAEQVSKLSATVASLTKDYELLEKENRVLTDKLRQSELSIHELQKQLECMEALHQRVLELESIEECSSGLKERIAAFQAENTQLRDRNDELTSQLEAMAIRPQVRREVSWEGGTKRKGRHPPCDCSDCQTTRLGKVRRCSTENDLTLSGGGCLARKQIHHSESGLESDLDTLTTSPTPSNSSLDNVISQEEEMEKLRAYVAELELQLDQYQIKEWELSKVNLSDEDSMQDVNTTMKSDTTQINTSFSNASDIISDQSLDFERDSMKAKSVSHPTRCVEVQTEAEGLPNSEYERLKLKLEHVQEEILKMVSEKKACTEENCALKKRIAALVDSTQDGNGSSSFPFMEMDIFDSIDDIGNSGITQFDELSKFAFEFVDPLLVGKSEEGQGDVKSECSSCTALREECSKRGEDCSAMREECLKQSEECTALKERTKDLETSLEMMREEYERTEDYWANKLDEERRFFEADQLQSDEKFAELEAKIQEYAELLGSEQRKPQLPTIEERDLLEKQFTDLEEEYDAFRQAAEEELAQKDSEILSLEQTLASYRSSTSLDSKNVEVQTEGTDVQDSRSLPGSSKIQKGGSDSNNCWCSCHWERRWETRRWREARDRLRSQCDQLNHQRQHCLGQLTSAQLSGRDAQIIQMLSGKLRQQEAKFRGLQSTLRNQQKQSAKLLNKAWERHKADLNSAQETLQLTQERLQIQTNITRQQLEKLARADVIAKDLFVENSRLMLALARLEEKCSPAHHLFNSF